MLKRFVGFIPSFFLLTDEKGFMGPQDYECESERLNLLTKGLREVVGQIEEKTQKDYRSGQNAFTSARTLVFDRMIAATNTFRDFTDARKFCGHVGVALFPYT